MRPENNQKGQTNMHPTHKITVAAIIVLMVGSCSAPPPAVRNTTQSSTPPSTQANSGAASQATPANITTNANATALPTTAATVAPPQAPTPKANPKVQALVRFSLDWLPEGPSAPYYVALEKGYFADEGLQVTIDPGRGSANTNAAVAEGSFDIGVADINSMMEFNDKRPDQALLAIAVVYNVAPLTIATLRQNNIREPKDLIGKKIGAPAGDAARRLWPLLAQNTGLDPNSVEWITLEPAQREAALARGEVDAISGFYSTMWFGLVRNRVSRNDIVTLRYSDFGLALYGNAIISTKGYLDANPEVAKAFLRALSRAWRDTVAEPKAAIEILKSLNPNIDAALELRRLEQILFLNYVTAEVKQIGFGQVVPDRLSRNIDIVARGFNLAQKPLPNQVFIDAYLPPLSERLPPVQ